MMTSNGFSIPEMKSCRYCMCCLMKVTTSKGISVITQDKTTIQGPAMNLWSRGAICLCMSIHWKKCRTNDRIPVLINYLRWGHICKCKS